MVGIVLTSHGCMAAGMLDSAKLLFSNDIKQLACVSLEEGDDPEAFRERLMNGISSVNDGDGVIVLVDLFGGTPCNQALHVISDKVIAITGMNLPMLLELLIKRESSADIEEIINIGKAGIINLNQFAADI